MKKIFLLGLLLLPLIGFTQISTYANYEVASQQLVYKKVFEPDDTARVKQKMLDLLKMTTGITNVQDQGNFITADIKEMNIDYVKHGGKPGWLPIIVQNGINGRARIDLKDGRYRLTVQNIEFIYKDQLTIGGYTATGNNNSAEELTLEKDRNSIKNQKKWLEVLGYMDKHFQDVFTLKQVQASEDW